MKKQIKEKEEKTTEVIASAPEVSTVKFLTYKMSTTVKSGEYSNVIAEIYVEGGLLDEAEELLMRHIDAFREKYNPTAKKLVVPALVAPKPVVAPVVLIAPVAPVAFVVPVTATPPLPLASNVTSTVDMARSEAYLKARNAIQGAKSLATMEIIKNQIIKSIKLTDEEKQDVIAEYAIKIDELNGPSI